jgi:hypothetical protein
VIAQFYSLHENLLVGQTHLTMYGRGPPPPRHRYEDTLSAFSSSYFDKPDLEETGRVNLPSEALQAIMQAGQDSPNQVMLFEIRNPREKISCFAGVREFVTPPGQMCMPFWMMQFLKISEGDQVQLTMAQLHTATRVIFRPLDEAFDSIARHQKVILEKTLRDHPCLNQGSQIKITFNNTDYQLKVLKTEPDRAVFCLRADVECDFAPSPQHYTHRWSEPDTDSSGAEEEARRVRVARTLDGRSVTSELKPLRSTFDKREKRRLHPPREVGKRLDKHGDLVVNDLDAAPKPKTPPPNYFVGEAKTVKKKKGAATEPPAPVPVADAASDTGPFKGPSNKIGASKPVPMPVPVTQVESKPVAFVGPARKLGDAGAPPQQEQQPQKQEPPSERFKGPARRMND